MQNQNSFEAIHQLLQEITSSSDSSEEWESDSAFSSESTEVENNESIPQTTEKSDLSACAVIDIIEGEIRSCGDTENLCSLWQLVGMWQLDQSIVEGVGKNLDKLGV